MHEVEQSYNSVHVTSLSFGYFLPLSTDQEVGPNMHNWITICE